MGESAYHTKLVKLLADWIADSYTSGDYGLLLMDLPEVQSGGKPIRINNFVPDVILPATNGMKYIVGEAETRTSIESRHTKDQIQAFLLKCKEYDNSCFVLAVPWDVVRLSKALLRKAKLETDAHEVNTIVIEQLPAHL